MSRPESEAFDHKALVAQLPRSPGVYRMLDGGGALLYVGKAVNLRSRVSSYFRSRGLTARLLSLVARVRDIQVTRTRNESEALLLEQSLIKSEKPYYNVMLRDDKSYPYIHITEAEFPQVRYFRGSRNPRGKLYGPYPSSAGVRRTLDLLQRELQLRSCTDNYFRQRTRPCLKHQIGRCSAPCTGRISQQDYAADIRAADALLHGRSEAVIEQLQTEMDRHSKALDFEQAAKCRDRMASIRRLQHEQAVYVGSGDADALAAAQHGTEVQLHRLSVRDGSIIRSRTHRLRAGLGQGLGEVIGAFIAAYYLENPQEIPLTLICQEAPGDVEVLSEALSAKRNAQVRITSRVRARRAEWLRLARDSAEGALQSLLASRADLQDRFAELARLLGLPSNPEIVECFDISHTGGSETYAAAVSLGQQGAAKQRYRRYRIREAGAGDDYAALAEAVERHLRRCIRGDALADVLLIDGGKGQVNAVRPVLERLGVEVPLLGIAKGRDRLAGRELLIINGREKALPPHSGALLLLQQVRDEAHRFAITGHRAARARAQTRSVLQEIEGIGPVRQRSLLRYFGGQQELERASEHDIAKVPGIGAQAARAVYEALHPAGSG
ncbi:MAG: excinuclease ABC subunit UvrC [Gammaproteobacteria bacterium AqS3]|nr:excinuclease ABC subunit UvrC [Gammaproteobacteria bacterium AqS3]